MNPRHKTKAITGVAVWFALPIVLAIFTTLSRRFLGRNISESASWYLLGGWLLAATACFMWGGYHLTKAKGYPQSLLLAGLLGPCLQLFMLVLLLALPDKRPAPTDYSAPRKSSRRHESQIERIVRFRRNAMLGNVFGLLAILGGIKLVLFPTGLFKDYDNETALGVLIFLCGYSGVITGCWWWAKAKGWPEAIVFIGLSPLVILFIPYVRLIFFAAPQLLSMGMVMMPLILLVTMLVLPDKSGLPKRRNWY